MHFWCIGIIYRWHLVIIRSHAPKYPKISQNIPKYPNIPLRFPIQKQSVYLRFHFTKIKGGIFFISGHFLKTPPLLFSSKQKNTLTSNSPKKTFVLCVFHPLGNVFLYPNLFNALRSQIIIHLFSHFSGDTPHTPLLLLFLPSFLTILPFLLFMPYNQSLPT